MLLFLTKVSAQIFLTVYMYNACEAKVYNDMRWHVLCRWRPRMCTACLRVRSPIHASSTQTSYSSHTHHGLSPRTKPSLYVQTALLSPIMCCFTQYCRYIVWQRVLKVSDARTNKSLVNVIKTCYFIFIVLCYCKLISCVIMFVTKVRLQ